LFYLCVDAMSVRIRTLADLDSLEVNLVTNQLFVGFSALEGAENDDGLMGTVFQAVREDAICDFFDEAIIRKAMGMGFFPMSLNKICMSIQEYQAFGQEDMGLSRDMLVIRHHFHKMIITPESLHIPKNTGKYIRKRFADYTVRFNCDFEQTVSNLLEAYPETWLCEPLLSVFRNIHNNPDDMLSVDSVEIYNPDGELVAGELGFVNRNIYTSLTGYHKESDIGMVQMSVLGMLLFKSGFAYWDLGMEIPYKTRYGAIKCGREEQAEFFKKVGGPRLSLNDMGGIRLGDLF